MAILQQQIKEAEILYSLNVKISAMCHENDAIVCCVNGNKEPRKKD